MTAAGWHSAGTSGRSACQGRRRLSRLLVSIVPRVRQCDRPLSRWAAQAPPTDPPLVAQSIGQHALDVVAKVHDFNRTHQSVFPSVQRVCRLPSRLLRDLACLTMCRPLRQVTAEQRTSPLFVQTLSEIKRNFVERDYAAVRPARAMTAYVEQPRSTHTYRSSSSSVANERNSRADLVLGVLY